MFHGIIKLGINLTKHYIVTVTFPADVFVNLPANLTGKHPLQLIEQFSNRLLFKCNAHIRSVKRFVLFKFWLKHSHSNANRTDLS